MSLIIWDSRRWEPTSLGGVSWTERVPWMCAWWDPTESHSYVTNRVTAKLPSTGSEERAQAHSACTKLLLLAWLVTSGCTSNSPVGLTENCNGKALEDEHPISKTLSCDLKLLETPETAWDSVSTLQLPSCLLGSLDLFFGLVLWVGSCVAQTGFELIV